MFIFSADTWGNLIKTNNIDISAQIHNNSNISVDMEKFTSCLPYIMTDDSFIIIIGAIQFLHRLIFKMSKTF